jgi:hypothetical protein
VLNAVRIGTDFQNPILRLGKAGNTYGKILNSQALAAMMGGDRHRRCQSGRNRSQDALARLPRKLDFDSRYRRAPGLTPRPA